jgi:hypothetical protein
MYNINGMDLNRSTININPRPGMTFLMGGTHDACLCQKVLTTHPS